jgi:methanogenic corrinoid protein MtbC1
VSAEDELRLGRAVECMTLAGARHPTFAGDETALITHPACNYAGADRTDRSAASAVDIASALKRAISSTMASV